MREPHIEDITNFRAKAIWIKIQVPLGNGGACLKF
jgi:hypothetical protein